MVEISVKSTVTESRPVLTPVTKLRLGAAIVVLAAYEMLARSGLLYEGLVPALPKIVKALLQRLADSAFYPHLGVTALEVASGFSIGTSIGLLTGIVLGLWGFSGRVFEPWLHYLASMPKIIFLPILAILFGIGMGSKIAMSAITSFFPVALSVYSAMLLVRPVLIRVMLAFNATKFQIVKLVYLPSLVAPALSSMRIALGVAIVSTMLAEIKLARSGIGYLIIQDYNFFRIPEMYAVLIIVFFLAWMLNIGMETIANRMAHTPTAKWIGNA